MSDSAANASGPETGGAGPQKPPAGKGGGPAPVAPPKSPLAPETVDTSAVTQLDYTTTVNMVLKLTDVRFQCLTFLTAVTAAGFAFISERPSEPTRLVLGLLGLGATLGIAIYDLRNGQLYNAAIHRAKALEKRLGLKGSAPRRTNESEDALKGVGLFGERPHYAHKKYRLWGHTAVGYKKKRMGFFFIFAVKHDRGLAWAYAAAFGAWAYLTAESALAMRSPFGTLIKGRWPSFYDIYESNPAFTALVVAALFAFSLWLELRHHDEDRLSRPLKPPYEKDDNDEGAAHPEPGP